MYCELPKYARYAYFDTRGEFTYESSGSWFVWYARTCSSTHGLHLVSYHILRIEYIFCTKSSRSLRSMPILTQGGSDIYGSTGLSFALYVPIALVRMVCVAGNTISHV